MECLDELTDYFTISEQESHQRLDKLLAQHFPEHSRTYFQFLIEQGAVRVNSAIVKKRSIAKVGDTIEVQFLAPPDISLEPQNIPLDILYEDEDLIAVNKPTGMVVHPAPGHPSGTFVNALLFHCRSLECTDPVRPGIVHRLDKDTSGILLAAKNLRTHGKLVEMFSERRIQKFYLAICIGTPKEGLIDAAIKRHPKRRQEMAVDLSAGKEAKSHCRLIANNASLSFVEVQLLTGRTHQIRVHMKYIGTPILGDCVYGSLTVNKKFQTSRQLLHAHRLEFAHPLTGTLLKLEAPIPCDFSTYLQNIHPSFHIST